MCGEIYLCLKLFRNYLVCLVSHPAMPNWHDLNLLVTMKAFFMEAKQVAQDKYASDSPVASHCQQLMGRVFVCVYVCVCMSVCVCGRCLPGRILRWKAWGDGSSPNYGHCHDVVLPNEAPNVQIETTSSPSFPLWLSWYTTSNGGWF